MASHTNRFGAIRCGSPLTAINRDNVASLRVVWRASLSAAPALGAAQCESGATDRPRRRALHRHGRQRYVRDQHELVDG